MAVGTTSDGPGIDSDGHEPLPRTPDGRPPQIPPYTGPFGCERSLPPVPVQHGTIVYGATSSSGLTRRSTVSSTSDGQVIFFGRHIHRYHTISLLNACTVVDY